MTDAGARFADTVTIVTGSSRGIGLAIAQRLVAEGGRVVLTGRRREPLDAAAAELGPAATAVAGRTRLTPRRTMVGANQTAASSAATISPEEGVIIASTCSPAP